MRLKLDMLKILLFLNFPFLQNILFRNSYIPFFMMETAFLSHINNMPDSVIFPSGDYCDMKNLERYYNSTNFEKKISTEDIEKY